MSMQVTVTQFSGGITEVLPSDSLVKSANYLKWLCGTYGLEAQAIINGGGGSPVSPVVPYGYIYYSWDYIITSLENGTSLLQNSILIDGKDVTSMYVNNNLYTVINNDFTFDKVTGTITWLTGTFVTDDRIMINFSRKI